MTPDEQISNFLSLKFSNPSSVVREIVDKIAEESGVSAELILSDKLARRFVILRHLAMWRSREEGLALTEIGEVFNRDHTSVINGIRRAEQYLEEVKDDTSV